MTNEEAKQEAIKKAWIGILNSGELEVALRSDGFIDPDMLPDEFKQEDFLVFEADGFICRPKELIGLESNNGWTRIEDNGSNFPKDGFYKVRRKNEVLSFTAYFYNDRKYFVRQGSNKYKEVTNITHFKPIEEELLPLY